MSKDQIKKKAQLNLRLKYGNLSLVKLEQLKHKYLHALIEDEVSEECVEMHLKWINYHIHRLTSKQ